MRRAASRIVARGRQRVADWPRPRAWVVLGLCFVLALLGTGLLLSDPGDPPNLVLFIGRFHPMIVHFPIGLIVLAALLEGVARFYRPLRALRHATAFVLFLGAVGAVAAVIAGYFLSLEGGHDPALLQRHMWLGIGVAVTATAAAALSIRSARRRSTLLDRAYTGLLIASVGTLILAGHLGGSLSHGEGYLTQYLPAPVRGLLGPPEARAVRARVADIDSAHVYQDLIAPVLRARCVSCHSATKLKGGLRLDTPEGIMEGGENGLVVIAGDPDESELLLRIIRPPSAKGAMPPNGAAPLDVGETELIRWWIAHGASLDHRVGDIQEIPSSVATLFNRIAPPRAERKPGIYAFRVPAADPAVVAALKSDGYAIAPIALDLPLLEVSAVNLRNSFGDAELIRLLPVAGQIGWLDLSGTAVGDAGLSALRNMPVLTRLRLERTAVSDEGLRHLRGLERLEYLNLFDTHVTDAGLEHLEGLTRLKVLYLWQTGVTKEGLQQLQSSLPDLRITVGTLPGS